MDSDSITGVGGLEGEGVSKHRKGVLLLSGQPQGKFLFEVISLINLEGGPRAATCGWWYLRSDVWP